MSLGGFLQGVGLQMGYNDIYGTKLNLEHADLKLKQQQVQMNSLAMQQQKQIMTGREALMKEEQTQAALNKGKVVSPMQAASQYDQLAQLALGHGDFQSATAFQNESKTLRETAKDTALMVAKQKQSTEEDAAKAAIALKQNPTEAGYHAWVANMAKAGQDVSKYPATLQQFAQNPGAMAALGAASTLGESSKDILASKEKQREFQLKQQQVQEEQAQRRQDRLTQQQLVASMHEQTHNEQVQARLDREQAAQQAHLDRQEKMKQAESGKHFDERQKLVTTAETANSDTLKQYKTVTGAMGAAMQGSAVGDQQLRQALPSLNSFLKGRATNVYYKDNANFGNLAARAENAISRFTQGKFSEADRGQIVTALHYFQAQNTKELNDAEIQLKENAKAQGLDPNKVQLPGTFPRVPEGATATGLTPDGNLAYEQDGKWYLLNTGAK